MAAFEIHYVAYSKHVPWGGDTGDGTIILPGEDLSAAAFKWCFSLTDGGAAAVTLETAAAGSQGVSATYDATYADSSGAEVGATTIVPLMTEATIEALTFPAAPAPLVLYHDFLITPSGGAQRQECYGMLTIYPGIGD